MAPDMMNATRGGPHNHVKTLEAVNEVGFGSSGIFLATAVGHRLPTAGLFDRIPDRAPQPLEKFQRRYGDLGEEGIDVAGYEKPDSVSVPPRAFKLFIAVPLCDFSIQLNHIFYFPALCICGAKQKNRACELAYRTRNEAFGINGVAGTAFLG
jgi:hypothetical protein